jgi:hypothetical protein
MILFSPSCYLIWAEEVGISHSPSSFNSCSPFPFDFIETSYISSKMDRFLTYHLADRITANTNDLKKPSRFVTTSKMFIIVERGHTTRSHLQLAMNALSPTLNDDTVHQAGTLNSRIVIIECAIRKGEPNYVGTRQICWSRTDGGIKTEIRHLGK